MAAESFRLDELTRLRERPWAARLGPRGILAVLVIVLGLGTSPRVTAAAPDQEGTEFFERSIRPLLVERCYECHSKQAKKLRGGLRLDSREGWRKGGDRGPAIEPGKPEGSLLIQALGYQDEDLRMPPKGKLPDREIALLTRWVAMGAPDPREDEAGSPSSKARVDITRGRALWAFRAPDEPPIPTVGDRSWPGTPLDHFILAGLEAKGLRPVAAASQRTLIRRATFDLIGLPPTPEQVEAFLEDNAPDAFARVVDRLLASPQYGERWGRHWLDVARYADSNGLDENVAHGNAWRYRDYVIAAFNRDKPFDRFLIEQIAGDLLPAQGGEAEAEAHERLIATGFLAMGPKVLAEVDETKMEMDIVDEQIDTVGRAFLGLTLGCARCHDHKFDPIDTTDYYALAGIFRSTRTMETFKKVARWHENPLIDQTYRARRADHDRRVADQMSVIRARIGGSNDRPKARSGEGRANPRPKAPPSPDPDANGAELARLRQALTELEKSAPEPSAAMGVTEGRVADARVHLRGSHLTLGEVVPRRVPLVLAGAGQPTFGTRQSGRLELARWLADPRHPLTSRVMVNRIWRGHFGRGLAPTPDNFGALGGRPVSEPLLDWLARRFVEHGWSIKAMHRLIMLSKTYQMGHDLDASAARLDPEDRLQWRFPPRRLEAEAIRDALLAVSAALDPTIGGSLLRIKNREYFFDHTSKDGTQYDSHRRSVYLPIVRNHLFDAFDLFDYSDASVPNGDRATTTVAPQALFFMNSDLVEEASRRLAGSLLAEAHQNEDERLRRLYIRAFGRPPGRVEAERARAFLDQVARRVEGDDPAGGARRLRTWQALCRVILASNEFIYID